MSPMKSYMLTSPFFLKDSPLFVSTFLFLYIFPWSLFPYQLINDSIPMDMDLGPLLFPYPFFMSVYHFKCYYLLTVYKFIFPPKIFLPSSGLTYSMHDLIFPIIDISDVARSDETLDSGRSSTVSPRRHLPASPQMLSVITSAVVEVRNPAVTLSHNSRIQRTQTSSSRPSEGAPSAGSAFRPVCLRHRGVRILALSAPRLSFRCTNWAMIVASTKPFNSFPLYSQ